jgi:hypothetical protein
VAGAEGFGVQIMTIKLKRVCGRGAYQEFLTGTTGQPGRESGSRGMQINYSLCSVLLGYKWLRIICDDGNRQSQLLAIVIQIGSI